MLDEFGRWPRGMEKVEKGLGCSQLVRIWRDWGATGCEWVQRDLWLFLGRLRKCLLLAVCLEIGRAPPGNLANPANSLRVAFGRCIPGDLGSTGKRFRVSTKRTGSAGKPRRERRICFRGSIRLRLLARGSCRTHTRASLGSKILCMLDEFGRWPRGVGKGRKKRP